MKSTRWAPPSGKQQIRNAPMHHIVAIGAAELGLRPLVA